MEELFATKRFKIWSKEILKIFLVRRINLIIEQKMCSLAAQGKWTEEIENKTLIQKDLFI